ncbi:MAG: type II toxin-antitoxin system RelE/ParE family toxin [Vulcanimicrobiota bacterium]
MKPALGELESQVRFKAENLGEKEALEHYDKIRVAADSLRKMPYRGRKAPQEVAPGYRELVLKPHLRIVYLVVADTKLVEISAVIDSRQDFEATWKSKQRRQAGQAE